MGAHNRRVTKVALSFQVLSLLLPLVASNPTDPLITPPAILPRDDDAKETDFVGYYWAASVSNELKTMGCGSSSHLITSGRFLACCGNDEAKSECEGGLKTDCDGRTVLRNDGEKGVCTTSCNTNTLFPGSTADANNAKLYIGCMTRDPFFYFQEKPPEAVSLPPTTTTEAESSTSGLETPEFGETGPAETSGAPSPGDDSKSESKAWIAGVVIGPIALIAIAAGAFWFFRRRRSQKQLYASQTPAELHNAHYHPEGYPSGYGVHPHGYHHEEAWKQHPDAAYYAQHASQPPPPSELPSGPTEVAELGGPTSPQAAPHSTR